MSAIYPYTDKDRKRFIAWAILEALKLPPTPYNRITIAKQICGAIRPKVTKQEVQTVMEMKLKDLQ